MDISLSFIFATAKLIGLFKKKKNYLGYQQLTFRLVFLYINLLDKRKMRKKLDYDYCSASPILEWLGDKWALVVLLKLHENEVIRFNELYKTIPSISEKMLSTVLRSLVTDGLVNRKIYPTVPPKVEYYVSEFGETLIPYLEQLKQWGQENFETIMENRRKNKY